MATDFQYRAVTPDGRSTAGTVRAAHETDVVRALQRQGLVVLRVTKGPEGAKPGGAAPVGPQRRFSWTGASPRTLFAGKPGPKDLILFAENLSVLLKAGIPLSRGLEVLGDLMENRRFSRIVGDVSNRIREGSSLWGALERHPAVFPPIFVNMVRAGEGAGVLDVVLDRVAEYLAGVQELKDYLFSSMIYPTVLGATAALSVVVMLTLVVPKFAEIFTDIGVELPLATMIMLNVGDFLQAYWLFLLGGGVALGLGLRSMVNTGRGRMAWDRLKLSLPMVGTMVQKIEVARFSRTMGTLLGSGLPILGALNIVKGVVFNQALRGALDQAYNDLKQGRMLSVALGKSRMFPPLAVHMLGVGEETGTLDTMLNKVGEMYDKDLKRAVKSFTALFEPLVILVMGLVIGAMVVSMLLAIFSINELAM